MNPNPVYNSSIVHCRMSEFLGARTKKRPTARYITCEAGDAEPRYLPRPASDLASCLGSGSGEIFRSVWDSDQLLADIDIEYVNFDRTTAAFTDPHRAFSLQAPVIQAIEHLLTTYGMRYLKMQTGRGFHYVWGIDRRARAFTQLAKLGRSVVTPAMAAAYQAHNELGGPQIGRQTANAFAGLGLVMEYVAHTIQRLAAVQTKVPIQLTDVEIGSTSEATEHGREIVSVDVSAYGDLINQRTIRMPFSSYLKPKRYAARLPACDRGSLPDIFAIPSPKTRTTTDFSWMRDPKRVLELAHTADARIPSGSVAMDKLISDYTQSPLAKFHTHFYAEPPHNSDAWSTTYDQLDVDSLLPCVRKVLLHPNDLLLRPVGIQHIVRTLLAEDWHPRHIAGLIWSKYASGDCWGDYWMRNNASSRSDFYTRLFSGLVILGHDSLVDFNCRSHQERGLCGNQPCTNDLRQQRARLHDRARKASGA